MSFVGKILVVFQLVLSLLFMAFAGVVYTAHMNWRNEALKQQGLLATANKNLGDKTGELETAMRDASEKILAAEQKAEKTLVDIRGLQQEVARLKAENGDLQVARTTSSQQALIAGQESVARVEEANNVRAINHELTVKRDKEMGERTRLEDENRSLQLDLEQAAVKVRQLLSEKATLMAALEANGITADVKQLATRNAPPPAVDGKIVEVKAASKKGSSELVEVSLGSDDGLKAGHQMTVYRSGLAGAQKARYLARIQIIRVDPDRSVGEVIENSRAGVIHEGDNVTTKL